MNYLRSFLLLLLVSFLNANAQVTLISVQDGAWEQPSTWGLSTLPTNVDVVLIGHDVNLLAAGTQQGPFVDSLVGVLFAGNLNTSTVDNWTISGRLAIDGSMVCKGITAETVVVGGTLTDVSGNTEAIHVSKEFGIGIAGAVDHYGVQSTDSIVSLCGGSLNVEVFDHVFADVGLYGPSTFRSISMNGYIIAQDSVTVTDSLIVTGQMQMYAPVALNTVVFNGNFFSGECLTAGNMLLNSDTSGLGQIYPGISMVGSADIVSMNSPIGPVAVVYNTSAKIGTLVNTGVLDVRGDLSVQDLTQVGILSGDSGRLCIADMWNQNGMVTTNAILDVCDATPNGANDMLVGFVSPFVTMCAQGPCSVPSGSCSGLVTTVATPQMNELPSTAYPNPSSGSITLVIEGYEQAQFTLYSIDGRQVFQQHVINQEEINLRHLPSGMYSYLIQNNGCRSSGKLMLQ